MSNMTPERLAALADQLDDFEHMLRTVEVVGRPQRGAELAQLDYLINRHPDDAGRMLGHT